MRDADGLRLRLLHGKTLPVVMVCPGILAPSEEFLTDGAVSLAARKTQSRVPVCLNFDLVFFTEV